MPKETSKDFKFIDLFAGVGGMRLAFEKANGQCVFSSEWDKYSQKTYEANFGEIPHGDITQIDERDIPKFDVLLAGFPCQPFSTIGKRQGFDHPTQGTLFHDVVRIMRHHRNKAFLLENVAGLRDAVKDQMRAALDSMSRQAVKRQLLDALDEGHKFDVPAIQAALATDVGYLGAMGSRRTCEERLERLAQAGADMEQVSARLHAPIGLDLGGRTPEETAIAICAEVIAARTGRVSSSLSDTTGSIH